MSEEEAQRLDVGIRSSDRWREDTILQLKVSAIRESSSVERSMPKHRFRSYNHTAHHFRSPSLYCACENSLRLAEQSPKVMPKELTAKRALSKQYEAQGPVHPSTNLSTAFIARLATGVDCLNLSQKKISRRQKAQRALLEKLGIEPRTS